LNVAYRECKCGIVASSVGDKLILVTSLYCLFGPGVLTTGDSSSGSARSQMVY
jgi:hypothetical protein